MRKGMVRVAMVNNCTTGTFHAQLCDRYGEKRNTDEFTDLIRRHSDVYASGNANIEFQMPRKSAEEDELSLRFNWAPDLMSRISLLGPDQFTETGSKLVPNPALSSSVELLMYAIPHHQERMTTLPDSTNQVLRVGCVPTLHGQACPVLGNRWALLEHLHRVGFTAPRPPRPEMLPAIRAAVETDINFAMPFNYQIGAGDTYFSGKMLAKLARILVVAEEVGYTDKAKFDQALARLRSGVEIWLNSSAISPFLYDSSWGGLVMCGCDFDGSIQNCRNRFPDCPALVDFGQVNIL